MFVVVLAGIATVDKACMQPKKSQRMKPMLGLDKPKQYWRETGWNDYVLDRDNGKKAYDEGRRWGSSGIMCAIYMMIDEGTSEGLHGERDEGMAGLGK